LPTAKEILTPDSEELGQQLFHAIWQDEHKKIKSLISKGADIEVRDEYGWTPLNRAAWRGKIDAVNILIEAGANLDATDSFSNTPLINAAKQERNDCIIALLQAGADHTLKGNVGETLMDVLKARDMHDTIAQAKEIIEKRPKKISQNDIDLILGHL
jgi:ankyrin repeat protein